MVDAARKAVALAGGTEVSILVDADTKVIVQGLTGSQGRFYGLRNRDVRHARSSAASRRARPAPTSKASRCSRRSPTR